MFGFGGWFWIQYYKPFKDKYEPM